MTTAKIGPDLRLFQKALIDKSESFFRANDCWILGADHLTFEEVTNDFREKNILQMISWGKKLPRKYLGKIISCTKKISLMTYNAKKILHRYMSGRQILTPKVRGKKFLLKLNRPFPPPHKGPKVNHLRGGGRKGLDILVNDIHQQNSWRAFTMWWFSRLKFSISRLKIHR